MIEAMKKRIRNAYKSDIGKRRRQLATPALILDLKLAKQNIQFMMDGLKDLPAGLKPHIKGQKSPDLARMQVEAGALGVCTATVWEAIVMSRSGIEDVFIANEVGSAEKIKALAQVARRGSMSLAVDCRENMKDLSDAASAARSELGILIDVDIGLGRGGVRSVKDALDLAQYMSNLPGLRFLGVMGYEGHCMLEPDHAVRVKKAKKAMDILGEARDLLEREGFECRVVSAGGTGTYNITGADPRVTEIQAGSYIFMDNFHGSLVPGFSRSLTVLSTVIMKHGNRVVMDAGHKSVGVEHANPTMVEYPDYEALGFHEEHALFDVDAQCPLKYGDTVEFIPGYAPGTVVLYDVFHVVEDDVVVDVYPIIPRGPGHVGIL
jgi:D-serine deaminase-like pyridoxal phosphate-dependent protein